MLYDLQLRDLGLPHTFVGVTLQLHDCPELSVAAEVTDQYTFMECLLYARLIGYRIIANGMLRNMAAVAMPDMAFITATMDGQELRRNDPLYPIVNDFDAFCDMREVIRDIVRKYSHMSRETKCEIGFFSLWLTLHDPLFANAVRQKFLDTLREHGCATVTIGCTEHQRYAMKIGPDVSDLSNALAVAATANHSQIITE